MFAETLLATWEIKNDKGEPVKPVVQTMVYAVCVSIFSVGVLYILTHPKLNLVAKEH